MSTKSVKPREQYAYKPTNIRNECAAWYVSVFISHDALTATNGFLKDNNLYFQVCKQ